MEVGELYKHPNGMIVRCDAVSLTGSLWTVVLPPIKFGSWFWEIGHKGSSSRLQFQIFEKV